MLDNGDIKQDLKLPDDDKELTETVKKQFSAGGDETVMLTVLSALGQEKIIAYRSTK